MSFRNRKLVAGQVFHDSTVIRGDEDVVVSVTGFFFTGIWGWVEHSPL